ncbi:hypothetical protein [Kocuria sabuli]|uniref:hypothetical protein n=1 Tax=Kocuria sabuli TaxID=3071448 RepID=UPI0034D6F277
MQLPGVLLLYGCFVVAASVATVLWSLTQAGLDLAEPTRRRRSDTRASAASHLSRATAGAAVAAVTAAAPTGLGHTQLLCALLSAL